ncbi:MAG: alpha/beta hydrolase [Anaerolineae bacterium]
MDYPIYDYGGGGPVIILAPANGFPPHTYRPLLEPLTARFRVVGLPPRALWPDPGPPDRFTSWRQMAADLLAALRAHRLENVIALGHSMGGVASLLAALQEPGRFRGLALLDPTILPPPTLTVIRVMAALGLQDRFPLVQGALRRRRTFASVDEAFAYWRGKRLFANWPDETLRLYAEGLTRPVSDGAGAAGGVELAWPPEWEAQYYRTIMTDTWRELPRLRGLLPTLIINGERTDTFTAASLRRARRLLPDAAFVTIAGHGHLFPQTAPEQARAAIEGWLTSLPPAGGAA